MWRRCVEPTKLLEDDCENAATRVLPAVSNSVVVLPYFEEFVGSSWGVRGHRLCLRLRHNIGSKLFVGFVANKCTHAYPRLLRDPHAFHIATSDLSESSRVLCASAGHSGALPSRAWPHPPRGWSDWELHRLQEGQDPTRLFHKYPQVLPVFWQVSAKHDSSAEVESRLGVDVVLGGDELMSPRALIGTIFSPV